MVFNVGVAVNEVTERVRGACLVVQLTLAVGRVECEYARARI